MCLKPAVGKIIQKQRLGKDQGLEMLTLKDQEEKGKKEGLIRQVKGK